MPMPVSLTSRGGMRGGASQRWWVSGEVLTETSMRPPVGVYLMALSRTLTRTCLTRAGSARMRIGSTGAEAGLGLDAALVGELKVEVGPEVTQVVTQLMVMFFSSARRCIWSTVHW